MLVEDEEAADAIVAAIGRLSYEQLQAVQVHALLSDRPPGASPLCHHTQSLVCALVIQ